LTCCVTFLKNPVEGWLKTTTTTISKSKQQRVQVHQVSPPPHLPLCVSRETRMFSFFPPIHLGQNKFWTLNIRKKTDRGRQLLRSW
jgi:hypothetical protein